MNEIYETNCNSEGQNPEAGDNIQFIVEKSNINSNLEVKQQDIEGIIKKIISGISDESI